VKKVCGPEKSVPDGLGHSRLSIGVLLSRALALNLHKPFGFAIQSKRIYRNPPMCFREAGVIL
jgi:hypothetical protein